MSKIVSYHENKQKTEELQEMAKVIWNGITLKRNNSKITYKIILNKIN